ILITGTSGFIGSHLADALSHVSCRLALVDKSDALPRAVLDRAADVSLHRLDICHDGFCHLISASRFDYIFHLAGNANVHESVLDPHADFRINLQATFTMLETLRRYCPSTIFVFASSAAVYGNPISLPISEDALTLPISPYGVSKLAAERYLN